MKNKKYLLILIILGAILFLQFCKDNAVKNESADGQSVPGKTSGQEAPEVPIYEENFEKFIESSGPLKEWVYIQPDEAAIAGEKFPAVYGFAEGKNLEETKQEATMQAKKNYIEKSNRKISVEDFDNLGFQVSRAGVYWERFEKRGEDIYKVIVRLLVIE